MGKGTSYSNYVMGKGTTYRSLLLGNGLAVEVCHRKRD